MSEETSISVDYTAEYNFSLWRATGDATTERSRDRCCGSIEQRAVAAPRRAAMVPVGDSTGESIPPGETGNHVPSVSPCLPSTLDFDGVTLVRVALRRRPSFSRLRLLNLRFRG